MNERIKELATEARLLTGWPVGHVEYQKFAELIVKECTDMLMLEHAEAKGQHNYYHVTANKLKKHFGVKE